MESTRRAPTGYDITVRGVRFRSKSESALAVLAWTKRTSSDKADAPAVGEEHKCRQRFKSQSNASRHSGTEQVLWLFNSHCAWCRRCAA